MKKILLISLFFLSPLLVVNAQSGYATAFFTGANFDDFSLGTINAQNGWQTKTISNDVITGCNVVAEAPLSLTSGFSYTAPGALSIGVDPNLPASQNGATFGCFSPSFLDEPETTLYASVSISILIDADDSPETIGSLYEIVMKDEDNVAFKVGYFADGSIKVIDIINGNEVYVDTNFTWVEHEWAQLTVEYHYESQTIRYIVNGITIYEGSTLIDATFERFAILHDNVPGSTAYFDDILVFTSNVAGVNKFGTPKFIIYPNPAINILTISNPDKIMLDSAMITDMNGKQIKSLILNTNADKRINIDDIASGIYILTVNSKKGSSAQTVVKH